MHESAPARRAHRGNSEAGSQPERVQNTLRTWAKRVILTVSPESINFSAGKHNRPLAANCTVTVPAAACAGFPNEREAVRTLLSEALGTDLAPVRDIPCTDVVQVSVYLPSDLTARSQRVARAQNIGLEEAVAGLAYARFIQRTTDFSTVHLRSTAQGAGADSAADGISLPDAGQRWDARAALQARLRAPLMIGLRAEKIVFAEGGTGLGKSRVIAQCALDYLRDSPKAKVLIMAPTVSVLAHLVQEFREVAPPDFGAISVVLGRSQFVSSKRLESLLSVPFPDVALKTSWEAAANWLKSGGQSTVESVGVFAREFSICWLADELRRVAPQFPTDDVLLGGSDEGNVGDPAQAAYQALRHRAFDEKISLVFATQAMACLNVWNLLRPGRQQGILPPFDLLLIDEAHELEEVMARTIGSSVSLLHMRQVLRQGIDQSTWQKFALTAAANDALGHVDRAERVLHQIPSSGLVNSWNDSDAEHSGRKTDIREVSQRRPGSGCVFTSVRRSPG